MEENGENEMTTTPIASALENETSTNSPFSNYGPGAPVNGYGNGASPESGGYVSQSPELGFQTDLLDAQQDLITAQHAFLHNGDQGNLLGAQYRFIMAQMSVLARLGVYGN